MSPTQARRSQPLGSGGLWLLLVATTTPFVLGCLADRLGDKLFKATEAGEVERVRVLIGQGADLEAQGFAARIPLTQAACDGHIAIVRLMLDAFVERDGKVLPAALDHESRGPQATPLACAAANGHDAVVRLLLGAGARIGGPGRPLYMTPLAWAAAKGQLETVRLLLESGADVNEGISEINDLTALMVAARSGQVEVVRELVAAGADLEASDHDGTALVKTTRYGHVSEDIYLTVVQTLVDAGANLEAASFHHRTALYYAASSNRQQILRFLIEAGANPDGAPDAYAAETPLKAAASRGNLDVVRLLLDVGADVHESGGRKTALMAGASGGSTAVVEALLVAGFDIDARMGYWPSSTLASAAEAGQLDNVRFLLEAGAEVLVEDIAPLEVTGDPRIIRLMRAALEP